MPETETARSFYLELIKEIPSEGWERRYSQHPHNDYGLWRTVFWTNPLNGLTTTDVISSLLSRFI